MDGYRIVSAFIVSANIMCITVDSAAVNTGRITQEIKGHSCPVTRRVRGLEGRTPFHQQELITLSTVNRSNVSAN